MTTEPTNATAASSPLDGRVGPLLPTRRGQPDVMTCAGPEHGTERGHWYSPAAVRARVEAVSRRASREIKQMEGQRRRLEDMLFAAGRMEQAPCFVCGYNGPDYYQPNAHKCAARHHRLRSK